MHRHRIRAYVTTKGETDVPVAIFADGQFLRFSGGVVLTTSLGPGTTTINALATWGDTTGTQLLNTSVLLDNAGNMTQLVTLDGQDAPRITATLATASPTTGKLTKWASSSAPWKLDHSSIEVVNVDGADTLYFVGAINGIIPERWVLGPLSGVSTDNAVVRWDGTTGRLVQNSVVSISDTGAITGVTTIGGVDPTRWVKGPPASNANHVAVFVDTTGKEITDTPVSIDTAGLMTVADVTVTNSVSVGTTINGRDPDLWVQGPGASTDNRVMLFSGTSGVLAKQSVVAIDSTGNITNVATINSIDPSNWVRGPASSSTGQLATFSGTTGKLIQVATVTASGNALSNVGSINSITVGSTTLSGVTGLNSITVGTSSLSSVTALNSITVGTSTLAGLTTINSINPSTWVVGPGSATDNHIARYDGTTGKLIQDSNIAIDDSGNITGAGTYNGRDLSFLQIGRSSILGTGSITTSGLSGMSGSVPGYGFTKRGSSYQVVFVCDLPVSFPDSSITLTISCSTSDNVGYWQVHSPNNSGGAALGVSATFAAGGTFVTAAFHIVVSLTVPSGSGTHNLSFNLTSSGTSANLDQGTQYWFEAT